MSHDTHPARRRRGRLALAALALAVAAAAFVSLRTEERLGPLRAPAADGSDRVPPRVGFAIVKTGTLTVREGFLHAGGDFLTKVQNHYSAFLVKHESTFLLFDTGLGREIREQYRADMPLSRRPFFRYEDPVSPARDQLAGVGPIDRIVLSHAHWDHASGVVDFPGVPVWVAEEELAFVRRGGGSVGGAWPSQVGHPSIPWRSIAFAGPAYEGFERSDDVFGDGTVVLVPMSGHTPGSVGLFVRTDSGGRYFFVGDVVWHAGALREGKPKFFVARAAADQDAEATQRTIERIRAAMQRDPSLVVVPAHDGTVQRGLGYFPSWVR